MKACVTRSMPLAQDTSGADPGDPGQPRRHFAARLSRRRHQNRIAPREIVQIGRRYDRGRQNDARKPIAAPGRRDDAHTRFVAAPQDDASARGGGGVGERHAPGAGAGDADPVCALHAVSRRILMLLGQW